METMKEYVTSMAKSADETSRKAIIDGLRDLAISLETPWDSMQRIMYLNFQMTGARLAIDLKLFDILQASESPLTTEQLAAKTSSDPIFLGRLLRYLASVRMIKETGKDIFEANKVTSALANPGFQSGLCHYFNLFGPILQQTPSFFAETKYQNPDNPTHTPFQKGWNTQLPVFLWYGDHPELAGYFNAFMVAQRGEMPGWLITYPIQEETKGWNPQEPVFVDIGGGTGHQCVDLKSKCPDLPGRVILQDLPHTIETAPARPGIEAQAHDFFTPQPVKGAKYYYMRNILHDWPDAKCREILRNIMSAMGPDSVILIDDMVLPATNVNWQATQIDFVMMTALASMERTEEQWHTLLDSVGLKAKKIHTYTISLRDSIIVAVPR